MPPQSRTESAVHHRVLTTAAACVFPSALLLLTGCTTTQHALPTDDPLWRVHALAPELFDVKPMFDTALSHRTTAPDHTRTLQDAPPPTLTDTHDLVRAALAQLGVKYRYGGKTPRTGFDCSGLVVYAAEQSLGLKLPHHAATLARIGVSIKRTQLQEGDLVFFNTRGRRFSHMGIYLGENRFVHAPRTGAVVRIERMDTAYWRQRYNGARRLDAADTRLALADKQERLMAAVPTR